jgi:hypothetical protein
VSEAQGHPLRIHARPEATEVSGKSALVRDDCVHALAVGIA